MSQYLHHIAAKSLALTPVVRPRLASLFEPPFEGANFARADFNLSDLNEENRNEPIAPFAANLEHSIPPTPDRASPPNPAPHTATTSLFSSLSPAHPISPAPRTARGSLEAEPATSPPVPASPPISTAPPIAPLPTPISAPLPTPVEPSQPLTRNEPSLTLSPPRLVFPRIKQATEPLFPTQPISGSPPRSPDRIPSNSLTSSLPPPPTIQITIGHIEVRAIAPKPSPAPVPKPRPAKPSLEEYLRSRSGSRASGNGGSR
jgi:hypothetical protein